MDSPQAHPPFCPCQDCHRSRMAIVRADVERQIAALEAMPAAQLAAQLAAARGGRVDVTIAAVNPPPATVDLTAIEPITDDEWNQLGELIEGHRGDTAADPWPGFPVRVDLGGPFAELAIVDRPGRPDGYALVADTDTDTVTLELAPAPATATAPAGAAWLVREAELVEVARGLLIAGASAVRFAAGGYSPPPPTPPPPPPAAVALPADPAELLDLISLVATAAELVSRMPGGERCRRILERALRMIGVREVAHG